MLSYLTFPVDILIQCCGDVETNPGPLDTELGKTPLLYEMVIFHRYIIINQNILISLGELAGVIQSSLLTAVGALPLQLVWPCR